MADEMPNWTKASEKLKQQSFKFLDKTARKLAKGKDKRETIDWGVVNEETTAWWTKKGYDYP